MSGITHSFISMKPDDVDATLVRSSNWNADHTLPVGMSLLSGAQAAKIATGDVLVSTAQKALIDTAVQPGDDNPWVVINGAHVVTSSFEYLWVTASAPLDITFKASPAAGDTVCIHDAMGNFTTYNVTVVRNGNTIVHVAENFVLDINNLTITFRWDGTDWGVL